MGIHNVFELPVAGIHRAHQRAMFVEICWGRGQGRSRTAGYVLHLLQLRSLRRGYRKVSPKSTNSNHQPTPNPAP